MAEMKCGSIWAPKELSLFTASSTAVLFVVTAVGNLLIIFIVIKDPLKKLHTPFNYFVVNLAVSDLVVGLVNFPAAFTAHTDEYFGKLNNLTAKVQHMSFFISVTASLLNIIALSVDRYIAITFPLKYRQYLSWLRCWCITGFIWLVSTSLPFVYLKVGYIDYLMIYANSSVILAFIVMIATYVRIYKFLRKQTRSMRDKMRTNTTAAEGFLLRRLVMEKKVTRVFLVVLVLFIATYLPAVIMIYILQYCPNCNCIFRHYLRDFSYLLIAMNSGMNPFVYTIRLKPFRQTVRYYVPWLKRKDRSLSTTTISSNNNRICETAN